MTSSFLFLTIVLMVNQVLVVKATTLMDDIRDIMDQNKVSPWNVIRDQNITQMVSDVEIIAPVKHFILTDWQCFIEYSVPSDFDEYLSVQANRMVLHVKSSILCHNIKSLSGILQLAINAVTTLVVNNNTLISEELKLSVGGLKFHNDFLNFDVKSVNTTDTFLKEITPKIPVDESHPGLRKSLLNKFCIAQIKSRSDNFQFYLDSLKNILNESIDLIEPWTREFLDINSFLKTSKIKINENCPSNKDLLNEFKCQATILSEAYDQKCEKNVTPSNIFYKVNDGTTVEQITNLLKDHYSRLHLVLSSIPQDWKDFETVSYELKFELYLHKFF